MVVPVIGVGERHAHKAHAVSLAAGNQAAPRRHRVAGLTGDAAGAAVEEFIVVYVCFAVYRGTACAAKLTEHGVFHAVQHKHGHVARGGVMLLIVKPVRVCKARIIHAELRRPAVHQAHKGALAPRCVFGKGKRRVVPRGEEQSEQQFAHGIVIPGLEVHRRAFDKTVPSLDVDLLVKLAVLDTYKRCHELCRTRDKAAVIGVLFIYAAAVSVHHHARSRAYVRRALFGISAHGTKPGNKRRREDKRRAF